MNKLAIICLFCVGCVSRNDPPPTTAQTQTTTSFRPNYALDATQQFWVEEGRWMINRNTGKWEYISNVEYQERLEEHKRRVKKMCEKELGDRQKKEPDARDEGDLP